MTSALEVRNLTVSFGRSTVVSGVSLDVSPGQVAGVVGPNGAGKTTLVDAITGFVASSGSVLLGGTPADDLRPHRRAGLGVARTFQSLELFEDLTVGENLAVAAEAARTQGRAGRSHGELVARAAAVAGIDDVLDVVPSRLSHGRRKQVALARALAGGPSVVLLDEPAAGLDGTERRELVATLRTLTAEGLAVVLVDHDAHLVFEVCNQVTVLDGGRVVAEGPPAAVRADPAVVAAWLGGPDDEPAPTRAARGSAPAPTLLELVELSAGWQGVPVIHAVDLSVGAGEVVALLGANGAGKTTTLLAISGVLPALGGAVRVDGRPAIAQPDVMARRGVAHAPQDRGCWAASR